MLLESILQSFIENRIGIVLLGVDLDGCENDRFSFRVFIRHGN